MQELRRMKSIETMERITRQKFCDNFDEILDRVDKEDIGFVILNNEGKDGHVLCPARWFQINFSDDLGCIITSALRYAIHRHTYKPGVVVAFIREYINILDRRAIEVAIRDNSGGAGKKDSMMESKIVCTLFLSMADCPFIEPEIPLEKLRLSLSCCWLPPDGIG